MGWAEANRGVFDSGWRCKRESVKRRAAWPMRSIPRGPKLGDSGSTDDRQRANGLYQLLATQRPNESPDADPFWSMRRSSGRKAWLVVVGQQTVNQVLMTYKVAQIDSGYLKYHKARQKALGQGERRCGTLRVQLQAAQAAYYPSSSTGGPVNNRWRPVNKSLLSRPFNARRRIL